MTALYVIAALLALLLLTALIRIRLYFSYYGDGPLLCIRVLFFKFSMPLGGFSAEGHKQAEKEPEEAKGEKRGKKTSAESVKEGVSVIKDAVFDLCGKFKRYIRLERYVLKISVGTDDPAKTAVIYGALSGVAAALHSLALSLKAPPFKKAEVFTEYRPDFYADRTYAAVDIGFSLRVWQTVSCLIAGAKYLTRFKKGPKQTAKNGKGGKEDERILS